MHYGASLLTLINAQFLREYMDGHDDGYQVYNYEKFQVHGRDLRDWVSND